MKDSLFAFKALYFQTAKQYLSAMIRDLEIFQKDPVNMEAISDFYISAHSMKGQSIAMEFTSTSTLCHLLERIGHDAQEGSLSLTPDLITYMSGAVDHLHRNVVDIERNNAEDDFSSEVKTLQDMTKIVL